MEDGCEGVTTFRLLLVTLVSACCARPAGFSGVFLGLGEGMSGVEEERIACLPLLLCLFLLQVF